jgi:suppressor of ftsI
MAAMMNITVEQLRNQTPEEHMQAMTTMMNVDTNNSSGFLPVKDIDVTTLPLVEPTSVLEVQDGDTITLNPTIVRKEINGKQFAMYGYNGQIPGPIIKAPEGATITVRVTNAIDMQTTVHWHGLRLDNAFDGVPEITQKAIQPGETFTYTVTLPDEGVYWYHPHVREDIQQDLGLYGNILVEPSSQDAYAPVNQQQVVILDDIVLSNESLEAYGKDEATKSLMGRFGNTMLVNGETDTAFTYKKGAVVRFYVTNVANTRTFKFGVPGATMKLVGSDVGRYEREEWVESVIIGPAERYIVDVLFEKSGEYILEHKSPAAAFVLANITIIDDAVASSYESEFNTLRENKDVIADIDEFRKYFDAPIDKTLELNIEMNGMDHSGMMMGGHTDDGIEWEDNMAMMNAMMTSDQVEWMFYEPSTGAKNMQINWQFKVGDVKKVRIVNKADSDHPMQHPVHFHGQRFLVLSMNGVPSTNLVWKDTAFIPAGSTAELLFDISNPGEWMFHCHIAEHLTNGMMGMFTVVE